MSAARDLDAWRDLGALLERLVADCEATLRKHCRDHAARVLEAAGLAKGEGAYTFVASAYDELYESSLVLACELGDLGPNARTAAWHLRAARSLRASWQIAQEELDAESDEDPWDMFWESLARERPAPPEGALDQLGPLADEIRSSSAPTSVWPLFVEGTSSADAVREAVDALAARSGISRADLPAAPPPGVLDAPLMGGTEAANALSALFEWAEQREAWSRTLGRVLRHVRPPRAETSSST